VGFISDGKISNQISHSNLKPFQKIIFKSFSQILYLKSPFFFKSQTFQVKSQIKSREKESVNFQQKVDIAIFDALHFRHNHTRHSSYYTRS